MTTLFVTAPLVGILFEVLRIQGSHHQDLPTNLILSKCVVQNKSNLW